MRVSGRLEGKKAVITGASRGIGRATALLFAREGADVCINYAKSEKEARQVQAELRKIGAQAFISKADVSDSGEVEAMVTKAHSEFGQIDILVNNAGRFYPGSTFDLIEDQLEEMFEINVKGLLNCTRHVAKHMMERKYGKIVNLGSIAGTGTAYPGTTAYAISKGAVVTLTKRFAVELGGFGINVNAVAPGLIRTDMTTRGKTRQKFEQVARDVRRRSLLGKIGEPEDISNAILFLASDESSFMTGQILTIDGGRTDYVSHSL